MKFMKLFFSFTILILAFSTPVLAQKAVPSSGSIQRFELFQSAYIQARNIDVWLPANFDTRKKYSVLYMHDGQMLFDSTINWNRQEWQADETITRLLNNKKIRDCIVVGIWNTGKDRHNDYCPQKPFESLPLVYRDSILQYAIRSSGQKVFSGKVQSDAYLSFLVKELKPFIDSAFPTKKDRAHTIIAGSSMGGLISLYAICKYPEVFGSAACLSTHWPVIFTKENNLFPAAIHSYLRSKLPSPRTHRIYFDYGDKTLDTLYKPYQLVTDQLMRTKGYSIKNWVTREFTGEDHSEAAWSRRFHLPLEFLMPAE